MNQDLSVEEWEFLKGRVMKVRTKPTDDDFLRADGSIDRLHGNNKGYARRAGFLVEGGYSDGERGSGARRDEPRSQADFHARKEA